MSAAKTEAPAGGTARGFGEQTAEDGINSISASTGVNGKTLETVQAALALKGYALHRLADGRLLIQRWVYSRTVESITQAAQFLAQIGGAV